MGFVREDVTLTVLNTETIVNCQNMGKVPTKLPFQISQTSKLKAKTFLFSSKFLVSEKLECINEGPLSGMHMYKVANRHLWESGLVLIFCVKNGHFHDFPEVSLFSRF